MVSANVPDLSTRAKFQYLGHWDRKMEIEPDQTSRHWKKKKIECHMFDAWMCYVCSIILWADAVSQETSLSINYIIRCRSWDKKPNFESGTACSLNSAAHRDNPTLWGSSSGQQHKLACSCTPYTPVDSAWPSNTENTVWVFVLISWGQRPFHKSIPNYQYRWCLIRPTALA